MSWDMDDLVYAAGFLDGEGCFTIERRENGRYHKAAVSCSNTHRPTIEWLHQLFGGSTSRTLPKRSNHRVVYTWQVVANQALQVCSAIVPYLKQKTEQALLLLMTQLTMGTKLTPEVREERERFALRVKELKHVAW